MNLFRGKHILPGLKEDFNEICKKIGSSFTGAMRLLGGIDGRFYQADLLVRNGNIVGASFEDLEKRTITFKEAAVDEIKKKLTGSIGTLNVYAFNDEDIRIVMMNNREAILDSYSPQIPLSAIGVRIKPMKMKVLEPTPMEKRLEIKPKGKFNLGRIFKTFKGMKEIAGEKDTGLDIERQIEKIPIAETIPKEKKVVQERGIDMGDITSVLKKVEGTQLSIKEERLSELRRKRQMEDMTLIKKISKIGKEEPLARTGIQEYEKIETSIDKLYELVQKHKRIRINDDLAHKLGITRVQIEGWAMILEEHNLVELHYSAMGEPEIRIKGFVEKKI